MLRTLEFKEKNADALEEVTSACTQQLDQLFCTLFRKAFFLRFLCFAVPIRPDGRQPLPFAHGAHLRTGMAQLRRKRPSALRHLPRLVGPPATVRPPAEALKWLGWSDSERRDSLDNVLATMNRLLIREKAHRCRNLPSKVVSMLLAAVRRDWPAVYGFEIFLVETFVDPADFAGTTYKASNWIEIGRTAGRGWCDRERKADAGAKTLYVYPLVPDFRRRLGLPEPVDRSVPPWARKGPLGRYEGLAGETWAEQECDGCDLGHRYRNARLVYSVGHFAKSPRFSAGAAMGTDAAGIKGWYRFIESPHEKVSAESMLGGHRECTLRRMMGFREVLVVQDGMDVSTSGKTGTEGLGPIGSSRPGSVTLGFKEHGSIAVGVEWTDGGIPDASFLGILKASFWSRPMPVRRDRRRKRPQLPAEKRESYIWIKHAESAEEAGRHMPGTIQIIVGDRGADSALLMYKVAAMEHCGLIARARSDRRLPGERHTLFNLMAKQPRGRTVAVDLCAKTERRNGAGKILSRGRKARKADLEIVFHHVRIAPPPEMAGADPLEITCVTAMEVDPPKGEEMIRWHLLSTLPVETHEDASRVVRRYHLRWIVEEFHGMLKSDGCDIESLAYRTVERMPIMQRILFLIVSYISMLSIFDLTIIRANPRRFLPFHLLISRRSGFFIDNPIPHI